MAAVSSHFFSFLFDFSYYFLKIRFTESDVKHHSPFY